jgi:hypothetical protein
MSTTYLYRFTVAGETFRYTSNAIQQIVDLGSGNETFTAASIRSEDLRGAFFQSRGNIIMADTLRPAVDFVGGAPNARVFAEIFDLDGTPAYGGIVTGCNFSPDGREARLEVSPWNFSEAQCPDRDVSPSCGYELGDSACGVNVPALGVVGTSVAVSNLGKTLTSTAWEVGDGYFEGGFVTFGSERAFVTSHVDGAIILMRAFRGVSGTYTAFPGCAKDVVTCRTKFNNEQRFGGFAQIPQYNPSARTWET